MSYEVDRMQGALQYIATHLDYYSFNTDEARKLKRDIQQWTVLPAQEQAEAAEKQNLLPRFRSMFANNPFLEQKGFVSDENTKTAYPGGVTGIAAEGFFDVENTCLTLREKGTQQGDESASYLTDGMISSFTQRKSGEAVSAVEQIFEVGGSVVDQKRAQFAHVLNAYNKADDKVVRHNPSLISAAITVCFYVMAVYCVFIQWQMVEFVRDYITRIHMVTTEMWIIFGISVAALLLGILRFRTNLNMVIKGPYRAYIRLRFRIAQKRQVKLLRKTVLELNPVKWYESYAEALKWDREQLKINPSLPLRQLRSSAMLNKPGPTIYLNSLFPKKPWSQFKPVGEDRKLGLMILMMIVMAVAMTSVAYVR